MVRMGCFTGGRGRRRENVLVEEGAGWIVHGDARARRQNAHIGEKGRERYNLKGTGGVYIYLKRVKE